MDEKTSGNSSNRLPIKFRHRTNFIFGLRRLPAPSDINTGDEFRIYLYWILLIGEPTCYQIPEPCRFYRGRGLGSWSGFQKFRKFSVRSKMYLNLGSQLILSSESGPFEVGRSGLRENFQNWPKVHESLPYDLYRGAGRKWWNFKWTYLRDYWADSNNFWRVEKLRFFSFW